MAQRGLPGLQHLSYRCTLVGVPTLAPLTADMAARSLPLGSLNSLLELFRVGTLLKLHFPEVQEPESREQGLGHVGGNGVWGR